MSQLLISIIIPVYNGEAFLSETIESVIKQSYTNWEALIIDDGSIDNSSEIIRNFQKQDSRIFYYYKENGGQASARNLGIEHAKGEWIALLDADDLWRQDKLEKQVDIIRKEKQVAICFTNTQAFEGDINNVIYTFNDKKFGLLPIDFYKTIYSGNYLSNSSLLIKKQVLLSEGGFSEEDILRGSEDWDLLLKLLIKEYRVVGIKDKLLYYRIHDNGIHLQHVRMFIGKTVIYNKYKNEIKLPNLLKRKQYRHTYRELLNYLYKEERYAEIKTYSTQFWKLDPRSFGTICQKIVFKLFSLKTALFISNKIIYRIAFRLEKLTYYFFLK